MAIISINNNQRFNRCPLCRSRLIHKVGIIETTDPVLFSSTEISLKQPQEYWRCKSCLSGFKQNIVSENEAREIYSKDSGSRWETDNFESEKTPEMLAGIEKYLKEGIKVLDFGCNTGELLDYCKKKGAKTFGVEYSQEARAICEGKGHKMFENINTVSEEGFDLIFAFDLVEHLYDPGYFFNRVNELLTKNGKLIILSGNSDSITARFAKNRWQYLSFPEHIIFPSEKFYLSLDGLGIVDYRHIYNSIGHRKNSYDYLLKSIILKIISIAFKLMCGRYVGQPTLGKDHHLIILINE